MSEMRGENPYMAVLVQGVVGELCLEEGDGLLHPVAAHGRGVGVNIGMSRGLWFGLSRHFPLLLVPLEVGRRYEEEKT